MIIVKLWGGLCNQMFQYAFGYQLSKRLNDELAFDTDFYKNQPKYVDSRTLELNNSFSLTKFEVMDRPKCINIFQNRYVSYIIRKMNFMHVYMPHNVFFVKEKEHKYGENIPYKRSRINYYDGYWQTEEYFNWLAEDIRNEFAYPENVRKTVQEWLSQYSGRKLISLHIRRGDLAGKGYGYSDKEMIEYYHKAIDNIEKRVTDPLFVVFSDDIQWCKTSMNWNTTNMVFSENKWGAIYDLCGISLCDHGIMSQSTYSWWGNWLGSPENRIVLAPKGESFNNKFIPERWEQI